MPKLDDRESVSPTTTSDASTPKKKRGRPGCDDDPRLVARNLRWLAAYAFYGLSLHDIGAGERDPVSARTVRRGIQAAQARTKARLTGHAPAIDDIDDDANARLLRNVSRRRAKPSNN